MFDIGFTEMMLIGVVTLIVLGPERLPKVARTLGTWMGRANAYMGKVKQDIDRDLKLEEFRRLQEEMHQTASQGMGLAGVASQTVVDEASHLDKMMRGMIVTERDQVDSTNDPEFAEIDTLPDAGAPVEGGLAARFSQARPG